MKISPSPTSTFDFNTDKASTGCLSGLVRRLLCKNLPHSALHRTTEEYAAGIDQEPKKPPPSPNLVARLMGLDSMPVHPYNPTESFVRSRSTNSIDGWNGFLSGHKNWAARHRTSHSFREEPTFLRKENDEFLVLSFTPDEKGEEVRPSAPSAAKAKIDSAERIAEEATRLKRNERPQIEGKENAIAKSQSRGKIKKEVSALREPKRSTSSKRRSSTSAVLKRTESECSSQNSSPASVLDFQPEIDSKYVTDQEDEKPKREKPRRMLSAGLKSDSYPSPKTEDERSSSAHAENKQQSFVDAWVQICRLAAEEVKRSHWGFREIWKSDDNEQITTMLGLEILDSLLNEVLLELDPCRIAMV